VSGLIEQISTLLTALAALCLTCAANLRIASLNALFVAYLQHKHDLTYTLNTVKPLKYYVILFSCEVGLPTSSMKSNYTLSLFNCLAKSSYHII